MGSDLTALGLGVLWHTPWIFELMDPRQVMFGQFGARGFAGRRFALP